MEKQPSAGIAQTSLGLPQTLGFNSALGGGAGLGGEQECGKISQSSVPLGHLSGQPGTLSRSPSEVSCRDLELFL